MPKCLRLAAGVMWITLAAACASLPARPPATLQPVRPVPLLLGINDGYHGPIPSDIVAHYCAWQRPLIVRAPVVTVAQAAAVLESVQPCPQIRLWLLVEQPDLALVQQLAPFVASHAVEGVELGNELDLAGVSPQAFAGFVAASRDVLRRAGYRGWIILGGIYTVDDHQPQDFADYVRPALQACRDCILGLHWYGDTSDYWLARVQAIGAPAVVTELGRPACPASEEEAQAVYLERQLQAYARAGNVLAAIVYQRPSAPAPCDHSDTSNLAHFGLQRVDGTWKPAERIFTR